MSGNSDKNEKVMERDGNPGNEGNLQEKNMKSRGLLQCSSHVLAHYACICMSSSCNELLSVTSMLANTGLGHTGNICIRFNSSTSWISAHQSTFKHSDSIMPILQMEEIVGLLGGSKNVALLRLFGPMHRQYQWIGTGEYVPIPWISDYRRWWVYDRMPYQVN